MHLLDHTLLQGGKYRIRRFISSGGFGCTYEAEHVLLEKRVAIKEFFVKDFCNRDENTAHVTLGALSKKGLVDKLRRKFIDEAKGLCKLRHPGIVKVSDVFEENGTAYFVMDYIDGKSLNDLVNEKGPIPEPQALYYIVRIADALRYVHNNNRLHLDLKPGNIMIDNNDNPILIDFGASKQYDEVSGENTSTLMGMTPGYAPPEQMSNGVTVFMPATDIYALGATLYKLLTGMTPIDANKRISGDELPMLPHNIGIETRNAVMAAMAINKHQRPQSIDDFLGIWQVAQPARQVAAPASAPVVESDEITVIGAKPVDTPLPEPANHKANIRTPKRKKSRLLPVLIVAAVVVCAIIGFFAVRGSNGSIEMVHVKGGTFNMGALPNDTEAKSDEKSVHKVTLSDFSIGKYEITQKQWVEIMGSNPSEFKGDNLPVENVSWDDIQIFIKKLNAKTGKNYRLPTEAEWEYAARGGDKLNEFKYSGSDSADDVAWFDKNSKEQTHPVGTKSPNALGIYDMSGNVWEWCSDWYDYYNSAPQTNPKGPSSGTTHLLRGGGWNSDAGYCRITYRGGRISDFRNMNSGFRLVLDE